MTQDIALSTPRFKTIDDSELMLIDGGVTKGVAAVAGGIAILCGIGAGISNLFGASGLAQGFACVGGIAGSVAAIAASIPAP